MKDATGRRFGVIEPRRLRLAAALALAALLLTLPATALAQTGQWSRPVQLSVRDQYSWFADIAADALGNLYVVYSSGTTGYDTVMFTASPDGETWSEANDIQAVAQNGGSEATRPVLLVDSSGWVNLTFRGTSVFFTRAQGETAGDAIAWSRPLMVSDPGIAYFSRLAQDPQGRLHAVISQNDFRETCPICYHLYYRWSDDGGTNWSEMVDLTPEIKGMAKPQLLVDSQGNLHAVFESGVGGSYGQLTETEPTAVMVVSSFDRGATWSEPLRLSGAVESARNITIGEDGGGRLLLAWQAMDDSKVYFQLSDNHGQSWLPPQAFDDFIGGWSAYNSRVDSYSMATDSRGGLHLVLVGRTNPETANLSVLHVTWNGARWLPVDTIAAYSGDAPEWPRIAISNGNELNVVWTLRDKAHIWDSDGGRYKVYYARTLADAPWVAPVAYDPRPSQPTAAVLTRPRETPVAPAAVPTPLAGTATAARSAYSETEVALIVLGSILPALVVVALVFGVARYRRAH